MIFQLPEGTRLSERVEARNRLLQAYDEEVTILRTLSRTFGERWLPNCRGKIDYRRLRQGYGEPRDSRLSCRLQRSAGLTASLLVARRAPEKTQETTELANSLEKKRAKPQMLPGPEKYPGQLAVSSARAETRSLRQCPDAHTKPTTQASARRKRQPARS